MKLLIKLDTEKNKNEQGHNWSIFMKWAYSLMLAYYAYQWFKLLSLYPL